MHKPTDHAARHRIITDLNTTLLVEAGAGSGKTTSLVNRMVALIRTEEAHIGDIVAITFTRKAASELKSRFHMALEQAAREEDLAEVEQERIHAALQNLHLSFIGTIHSFCGRLLRERPLEAKVDPAFRELEEADDAAFRNQCWDDYLAQLLETGRDGEIQSLAALGIDVKDLRTVYHHVSQYPDVEIALTDVDRPDFGGVRDALWALLEEARRFLPTAEPEKGWDALQSAVRNADRQQRFQDIRDDATFAALLEDGFDKNLSVTQNRWTSTAEVKRLSEAFALWQNHRMRPVLRQWREHKYAHVVRFVQPAVAYCANQRRQNGLLNFQDLLMDTARLLQTSEEVRRTFQGRIRRLFVDEFQDTDPIQAEIMFLLTASNPEVSDWKQSVPAPGSLFIVGDPKQSIYRFRRADIQTYNFVKAKIQACGEVLQLNANFRSVHAIGKFVNHHFADVFPARETPQQAAFVTLDTQQPDPLQHSGVFTISHPRSLGNKETVAMRDAEQIGQWIAWACSGNVSVAHFDANTGDTTVTPARPGDFLILNARKEFLHLYAEVLEGYGIPSDVTESQQAYTEMHPLAELTQCLANPADKIALIATLRGIFCGVSDAELFQYKQAGYAFSLVHIPEACPSSVCRVRDALLTLRAYLEWTRRMPPLAALERIFEHTGFLVYTAAQVSGTVRAGMLTSLLQYLHQQSADNATWFQLAKTLRRFDESETAVESANLFPGRDNVVRIMNLHKAKGLEAPIVFLACPCGFSNHDASSHVNRDTDPARGSFVATSTEGFSVRIVAQPPGWEDIAMVEREFLTAERDRLLYVATTRSRQMLVISQWENTAKDPWGPLHESLNEWPELEPVEYEPEPRESLTHAVDVAAHAAVMRQRFAELAIPTWTRTSVTTETKSNAAQPERHGGGLGMAFGTVVHRCIESVGNGMDLADLRIFAGLAAQDAGLSDAHLDDVVEAVQGVLKSAVWQRSLGAKRRLFEVPFTVVEREASAADGVLAVEETAAAAASEGRDGNDVDATRVPRVLQGVIDFAFEEEDGWVIVDFKTDAFEPEREQEFVVFYQAQVQKYVEVWRDTFGMPVKEAGLYFTRTRRYVVV